MRSVIDEGLPELPGGGIAYVLAGVILVEEDAMTVKERLEAVIATPGRKAPFHWHQEGAEARSRMVQCLVELGATALVAVHHPTGRKRQEEARRACFEHVVPELLIEGATDLLIESRAADQDRRDQATMLELLRELDHPGLTYRWGTKATHPLWLADAVCGAVTTYLTGTDATWYQRLRMGSVLHGEPHYISGR